MKEFYRLTTDVSLTRGRYPGSRSVEELLSTGLIILDKWQGVTSRDVDETVKRLLHLKKVGHAGTLDPNVSGVLPIALDDACKVMPALQGVEKEYVGVCRLHHDTDEQKVRQVMKSFVGTIRQRPPVRSAVSRRERERDVYSFELLEKDGNDLLFRIRCQAGTYVRVICHELGQKLETGGHLDELRRTRAGRFDESF